MTIRNFLIVSLLAGLLSGCTSISRGVTQAIMEQEVEDNRRCWITGRAFVGLDKLFSSPANVAGDEPAKLKVMSVHGIGSHNPGHSRRLLDGLIAEFGFTMMDERVKTIQMVHPDLMMEVGILRVYRYMDHDRARELLFYELTWDSIIEEEKKLVEFDNGLESSARRVPFNHTMKTFVNMSVPDALIYNTRYRDPIQRSVTQAACWMLSKEWEGLPDGDSAYCNTRSFDLWSRIDDSNIAIISHSLGSRISLDALGETLTRMAKQPEYRLIVEKLRRKPLYLYMLSNQLPLLQVGQALPEYHDQVRDFCAPRGARYEQRILQNLQIVAFSDPNDLFSYTVKPEFISRHVDSRLCPAITNVQIEIAHVTRILGTQAFANPQAAHVDYATDSRVLKLLVSGIGPSRGHHEIRSRCEFIETVPDY